MILNNYTYDMWVQLGESDLASSSHVATQNAGCKEQPNSV